MTSTERPGGLASGFAALGGGWTIVLLLAASTVALSILAAAPLGPSMNDAFARTLAGDHLLSNDPRFAATDLFDFLREKAPALGGMAGATRWASLLMLLEQILVAGGIVAALGRPGGFTAGEFVEGVRLNAWHNFKCFLIFVVAAAVSIGLWIALAAAVLRKAFRNAAPGETGWMASWLAAAMISILLYAILSLFHDFARACRRTDSSIGAWRAYVRAGRILSGRWTSALGLFFFWLVLGGLLLGAAVAFEWTAPAVSSAAIFLHGLLQIAVLAIRPTVRVAAWGSYLAIYDAAEPHLAPPPVRVEPPVVAPAVLTLEDQPLV